MVPKTDIISRLQKEILPLQGYKPRLDLAMDQGLGPIVSAFPGKIFPQGSIHEFHHVEREDKVATGGFIAGILHAITKNNGIVVWICHEQHIFPPALAYFGLKPEHIVFLELRKEKERMWAMEEALKCSGITAVVGEMESLSFTLSRRLQLAVEHSGVTGFMIRNGSMNTTTSIARWKVRHSKSIVKDDMPGIGFPAWEVDLLRVRNGKPMQWQLAWQNGKFMDSRFAENIPIIHRKTG